MKKSLFFILLWLYRLVCCFCIAGFFFLLFVPINQDMITMIKNDASAWQLQISQLWGNDPLQTDIKLGNRTTLQWAASSNTHPSVISFLTQAGNNINQHSATCEATPLQFAVENNPNIEVIEQILKLGADPDLRLADGRTAFLIAACFAKDHSILDLLRQYNADIYTVDINNQADALHWAADHNNNLEVIQYLVNLGLNVNSIDGMSRTPLIKAAGKNQNPLIVQFLIDEGAVLDSQDKNWETALIFGCRENKNPEVLQVLLDAGANVNLTDNKQKRAIDYARKNKNLQETEFLKNLEQLSEQTQNSLKKE